MHMKFTDHITNVSAVQIFENSNSYFTIRFETDTTIQNFQILLHNAVFGNYSGDYGLQECNKLLPSLVPIVIVFSSYTVAENCDKLSPFWTTIVIENGNKLSVLEGKNYSIRFEIENHYLHSTNIKVPVSV